MVVARTQLIVMAALLLVLGACGGSADGTSDDGGSNTTQVRDGGGSSTETTAPASDGDGQSNGEDSTDTTVGDDSGAGEAPPAPAVTEMGSFTVNDTEFAVTLLNRCIPFEGPDSDVIDLQPLAQGQGAQLNLTGTNDFVEVSVQGSAIREMFGSISFEADSFGSGDIQSSIDGDRWTGSATLNDSLEEADPVTIAWDVMIPDEAVDCSL